MGKKFLCVNCGYVGTPKTKTKGSMGIEMILWICLIIPGIIYSVWRLASRYSACPLCGAPNMIPADSPRAIEVLGRR